MKICEEDLGVVFTNEKVLTMHLDSIKNDEQTWASA